MKRTFMRGILMILLMLPLLAVAHFIIFPQETRCILIRFANFEKKGNIYFRANANADTLKDLQQIQSVAEKKVTGFWGADCLPDYRIIYCNNENDYRDYGREGTPATVQRKFGVSVVVSNDGLDISVIAHELSHGLLYNKIGWYKTTFTIPQWFDEGLATQVDDRDYYSIDTLMLKKNAGIKLPDVTQMTKSADFVSGSTDNIVLKFSTAKYIVHEWLKTHSLKKFISRINKGEGFKDAYAEKD